MIPLKPIQDAHLRFILLLAQDPSRDVAQAYGAVYPGASGRSAIVAGNRILKRPECIAKMRELEKETTERAMLNSSDTAQLLSDLATADARELIDFCVGSCRYCWGEGHLYQRTPREVREAFEQYRTTAAGKADPLGIRFDVQGGGGFNITRAPHPTCPECFGLGEGYERIKDTRTLSTKAALLYAGVHRTRDGLRVLTRSQDKAAELMAKHQGLFREPEVPEGGDLPPAAVVTYNVVDASNPQAEGST